MLVFIIAIKSAQVSKSWKLVEGLFERTIKSVCSQTSNQFRVIVVCHEKPKVEFEHANLTYLPVDFPIPYSVEVQRVDRRRKHLAGLLHAAKFNPTHTMYVDADDCVSKYLADFVSTYPLEFRQIGSSCTKKSAQSLEPGQMLQSSPDRVAKRWTSLASSAWNSSF